MDDIRSCLYLVDELLTAYVAIHDDVFKRSIRRLIPIPGLFKPLNHAAHVAELGLISEELVEVQNSLERLKPTNKAVLKEIDVFMQYTGALHDAVLALERICKQLSFKANGGAYSMQEYNADLATYHRLEDRYCSIGVRMNDAISVL